MAGPLYVPVLPWKSPAVKAYRSLAPHVRARIAPLWTVTPRTGLERTRGERPAAQIDHDPEGLRRYLRERTTALLNAHHGDLLESTFDLSGWIDAAHVEDVPEATYAGLWQLIEHSPLRPVTGPERSLRDQLRAVESARAAGDGLGIRVLIDDLPDVQLSSQVEELVGHATDAVPALDLLLDLGMVVNDGHEADKWGLAGLELLGDLAPWRNVVLLAGAFPRALDDLGVGEGAELPRYDWQTWRTVRAEAPETAPQVIYGDYGIHHAQAANSPPPPYGPKWGYLRYTAEESYLIAKVPTQGSHHVETTRAQAREIVESEHFRGCSFSQGDRWLHACAYGSGSEGRERGQVDPAGPHAAHDLRVEPTHVG